MRERPATRDDLPALVLLWRRFEVVASGAAETDEAAVRADWDAPGFDLATSTRVLDDGGRLVGYAVLDARGGADSVVDPEHTAEGLEDRLLAFLEERSQARGLALEHYWGAADEDAVARFSRRGWTAARTFWRMRRELDGHTPQPHWPDGVTVRGTDPGHDGPAVHGVVQDAFADIGDPDVRQEYDAWAHAMLDPERFDADLYVLAERDGQLLGVCLAQPTEGFAFIRQLAVQRASRGQGLALALLHESFRRHAARGFPATVLGVDAANATGAIRLYERAGMRVVEQFTRWERPPGTR